MERTGLYVFHGNISKNVALSLGLNTSYLIVVNKPHVAGLNLIFFSKLKVSIGWSWLKWLNSVFTNFEKKE